MSDHETTIEKQIHSLVEGQFPDFYTREQSDLVAFVENYYKWLEESQLIANYKRELKGTVIVAAGQANVIGRNSNFIFYFANGDDIAIYTDSERSNYTIHTIDTITNTTFLQLTSDTIPERSYSNVEFRTVMDQYNPLYYSRRYLDNKDIDAAESDFVVLFKEKYLKNIQFNTLINIRKFIKHCLDLYRSKGTERSIDLLYKAIFGTPAKLYYPGEDLFTLSSGKWFVPRYIEVSLNNNNVSFENKQITGLSSGATAFVDNVIRKYVKDKLIDIFYISAINGTFVTGEKLVDGSSSIAESPVMIGSLTSIDVDVNGTGAFFNIGDILDIESINGINAKARVESISNTTGVVSLDLADGGYAYTVNAHVLISDKILTVDDLVIPLEVNSYFAIFDQINQDAANLNYEAATGAISVGDSLFTYHPNNDVKGEGRVLISSPANDSVGFLQISIMSGDMDDTTIYTTGNAVNATLPVSGGYLDFSTTANAIGYVANLSITVNAVSTPFTLLEEVEQIGFGAKGTVKGFTITQPNVAILTLENVVGAFRTNRIVTGLDSGATGNTVVSRVKVGVKDVSNNQFTVIANNYIYTKSGANGTLSSLSQGTGVSFSVSNTLVYPEYVDINDDYLIDSYNKPFTHASLSGTSTVNTTSTTVTGAGTSFDTEIRTTTTGTVDINATANAIVGNSTSFDTEIVNNDIVDVGGQLYRVRTVTNAEHMVVNSWATTAQSGATLNVTNYYIFSNGAAFHEAKRVTDVADSTTLTVDSAFSDACTSMSMTESWAFPGNTAANLTNEVIEDILTSPNVEIGKISGIFNVNPGQDYDDFPMVRVWEPFTFPYRKLDQQLIEYTGATATFEIDEIVTQADTDGRGKVLEANATHLVVQKLRWNAEDDFVVTSNSTTVLAGLNSGAVANIESFIVASTTLVHGYDANVISDIVVSEGAITAVEVIDSGFGFLPSDVVTMTYGNNSATGFINMNTIGTGSGFYKSKDGFLSDVKKLHDGYYWQVRSYDVRSSVINQYKSTVKDVVHLAGTQYFDTLIYDTQSNSIPTITSNVVITT